MFRAGQCGLVRLLQVVLGIDDERADGFLIEVCAVCMKTVLGKAQAVFTRMAGRTFS